MIIYLSSSWTNITGQSDCGDAVTQIIGIQKAKGSEGQMESILIKGQKRCNKGNYKKFLILMNTMIIMVLKDRR